MRLTAMRYGERRVFQIEGMRSSTPQLVSLAEHTKVVIGSADKTISPHYQFRVASEGIGGLKQLLSQINRLLQRFGVHGSIPALPSYYRPTQGVLFYGPKGTGKSLLIGAITNCPWLQVYRLGPNDLRAFVDKPPTLASPYLIILSELESGQQRTHSETHAIHSALIRRLFEVVEDLPVLVVAETRHPNDIDESLRTPSRFSVEIEIPVPTSGDRYEILKAIRGTSKQPDDDTILSLAERSHGYVGADLFAVLQATVEAAWERLDAMAQPLNDRLEFAPNGLTEKFNGLAVTSGALSNGTTTPEVFNEKAAALEPKDSSPSGNGNSTPTHFSSLAVLDITPPDVDAALTRVRPTAMQEIFLETPNVHWSDIGGQEAIKFRLQHAVEAPLKLQPQMQRLNLKPKKGLLLYGPPGCSKTMLVKALACESGLNFLSVKGAEILSSYVGESERTLRDIFRKARAASPSIIFFDEIDAIATKRGTGGISELNLLTTLLLEMDGFEELKNVLVVAATNKPESIDPALLRPGRLDNVVYVGLPDKEVREQILRLWFERSNVVVSEGDRDPAEALATLTEGYSGAELVSICQTAGEFALWDGRDYITWEDLQRAVVEVPRGVTRELLEQYEAWNKSRR